MGLDVNSYSFELGIKHKEMNTSSTLKQIERDGQWSR